MTADEIRQKFLDFFRQRGHLVQPSASLSTDDPQLLFTIAGMVPFKPFFLGEKKPPSSRLTTCQLCFRTNDLDRVGRTAHHHTFFEMLGNFSFGDYFKEEACQWGWEFVTEELRLRKDRIWTTVFRDDEETYQIWRKLGVPSSRIIRKDEEENFWSLAEVGPCGPDTELFFDRGEEFGCGRTGCEPGCDCGRWVEIWNLVFMQFNRDEKGKLSPLPTRNIDTGMGLERIASVVQGVRDDYQTDLFIPLINWLKEISPKEEEVSFRVISDHLRALTFLLAEKILPSNTGRGYVVRRVLRRAFRYGRKIGLEEPFLYKGVPVVVKTMESSYPHLKRMREEIAKIIKQEEKVFQATLTKGMEILERIISDLKKRGERFVPPREVFKLYDTYGFPPDITEEIAGEEGLKVERKAFEKLLAEQKRSARKDFKEKKREQILKLRTKAQLSSLEKQIKKVEFKGYETLKLDTSLMGIIKDGTMVDELREGEDGELILSSTPFYPEGGGQLADRGKIYTADARAEVLNVQRLSEGIILHRAKVLRGKFEKGAKVRAEVDEVRRKAISRAHTATHLLQAVLREIFGEGVQQSGSLVDEDRLRFDFTHTSPLSGKELEKVTLLLNEKIRENLSVKIEETSLDEARRMGAIALFEEKYGERVRVVSVGDFSREVCGGTHLTSSGEIGLVKIISETGVASGIRRIEALVGEKALRWVEEKEALLRKIALKLRTSEEGILARIEERERALEEKDKQLRRWQRRLLDLRMEELLSSASYVGGKRIVGGRCDEVSSEVLRETAERLRDRLKEGIVVLASGSQKKSFLVAASTEKSLPANQILREVARLAGGNAGGRWDFAQGGTSQISKVDQALRKLPEIVERFLNQGG
ncbi:alanine--tRNA ligase [Candidatus Aerophobetes bacterium]|uniref:Alanine--tRNA ligase n=1 Tax=Aerophobetes bacterium TaxID=2030807 RepID=A0A497E820_UNCAE|nr:MAG: alanine--tRNA ligase [Candidatus Aerophobetes bacterium]